MTLQGSGQITAENINVELGNSSAAQASMDAMTAEAEANDLTVKGEPDGFEDWYGYSHVPNAPTKCNTGEDGGGEYCLWNDNSSIETGFTIEYKVNGGGWQAGGTAPAGSTKHYITGYSCQMGDDLYTRVKATNAAGSSSWCEDATPLSTTCT